MLAVEVAVAGVVVDGPRDRVRDDDPSARCIEDPPVGGRDQDLCRHKGLDERDGGRGDKVSDTARYRLFGHPIHSSLTLFPPHANRTNVMGTRSSRPVSNATKAASSAAAAAPAATTANAQAMAKTSAKASAGTVLLNNLNKIGQVHVTKVSIKLWSLSL